MRIEVVHHQHNPFCNLVLINYFFKEFCPINSFLFVVIRTIRLPTYGSLALKMLQVPFRLYS